MTMIVKMHKTSDKKLVLAVCDGDLVGKKFEEGNRVLDLTGGFYKGDEKSEEDVINLLKKAYIANLVGENSVKLAIKAGFVNKDSVIEVKGIPHAQVLM